MQVQKFDNEFDWKEARKGKITGSKLGDIVVKRGSSKKIGFYQLIADRLALSPDDENAMERGHRLEPEALNIFESVSGKTVDKSLLLWVSDINPDIALSPDGVIGDTEAVEVKCLASARHIEALLTNKVPSDYSEQVVQYFIVNEKLEKLYFCFYDPRMKVKSFFFIEVTRSEIEEEIKSLTEYQINTLKEVNEIVEELSSF